MDQLPLLLLAAGSASAGVALAIIALRQPRSAAADGPDTLAVSTEGMKRCGRCAMGNLWTARTCSACGGPLKG